MTVSNIIGGAWDLYTRFFARFFVLAFIVFLITGVANAVVASIIERGANFGGFVLGIIALAVTIVGTYWVQGALVFAVQDTRDGSFDSSNEELLRKVRPHLGTLIIAGILAALGVGIGLIFLIVPGLILLTWWALIVPVIVLERKGVLESFGRSRQLVRGHAWTVFAVVVLAWILSWVASAVIRLLLSFLPTFLEAWLGSAIAGAVIAPFLAVAVTLMYFALCEKKAAAASPSPPDAQI